MAAVASHALRPLLPRPLWRAALRAVMAGAAWGGVLTLGFTAYAWSACGIVCLDDVLAVAAVSMAAGTVTIGPLAAFAR